MSVAILARSTGRPFSDAVCCATLASSSAGWNQESASQYYSVADSVRGAPILDIGVGGGRTAPLMHEISSNYCGIDFAPAMVARRRFPGFDFREMDARRMEFNDATFTLATFSYNGIDSVDLEGRHAIMHEVHRVLRPGGYFVFSTLNRNGSEWLPHWPNWDVYHGAGVRPLPLLRSTAKLVLSGANRLRWSRYRQDYGEAAIGSLAAHDFSLVTMFTTPAATHRQLQEAGFVVEAMFDPDGHALPPDEWPDTTSPWYHVVARKHGADGEGLREATPAASVH